MRQLNGNGRSLATKLHGKSVPLKAIGMTGHESLDSLARYIDVTPEKKRAAVMSWQGNRLSFLKVPGICNRDRGLGLYRVVIWFCKTLLEQVVPQSSF